MPINFAELEKNELFRSDMLYFIRMANPYIKTIFWDVFSVHNKKRRQSLYQITKDNLAKEDRNGNCNQNEKYLLDSIIPDPDNNGRRSPLPMDCISGIFVNKILNVIAAKDELVKTFNKKLRENFSIFGKDGKDSFTIFREAITTLYKRRNLLEHYNDPSDKKKPNSKSNSQKYNDNERHDAKSEKYEFLHTDEKLIEALGLFLLPEITHHLVGRIASYEKAMKIDREKLQSHFIREMFRKHTVDRKESTKLLFSNERTRKNIKDKRKRKSMVDESSLRKKPWYIAYENEYKKTPNNKTIYRIHEFKLRYYFIGENNIAKIKKLLDGGDNSLSFKHDIETFYILTTKINLFIQRYLFIALNNYNELPDKDLSTTLKDIRNRIAHNGFFWDVKKQNKETYSVKEIFTSLIKFCYYHGGKSCVNDFYTQIASLLKKQKFSIVHIKDDNQHKYLHIREWTRENRNKYLRNQDVIVDRRKNFYTQIAKWKMGLDKALKNAT